MYISIIIPIYNVEPYIKRCLMSCINQDEALLGREYEIICVNDGTQDRSALIAEEIANCYDGIRVINQANQGLSVARNTGIKASKGEYIWFIDSDDWIEPDSLKHIFPRLKDGLDLLHIQHRLAYENGDSRNIKPCLINGIVKGGDQALSGGVDIPAQFTICRKEFLIDNNIWFFPGIYHEDVDFKPRALLSANKISSISHICYNYYQRSVGAITSIFKVKNGRDLLFVANRLMDFGESVDIKYRIPIYNMIGQCVNSVLYGMRQLPEDDYRELFKLLRDNSHLFSIMQKSNHIKYQLEGYIFTINFNIALRLYKLVRRRPKMKSEKV